MEGRRVGRYLIGRELAAGGMATVHLGRMQGPAGFGKTVAIKRLHAQFAKDSEFSKMFLDEARVTSGLMHPNIVMTLDVLEEDDDGLYLVMEYVHGVSLAMIHREVPRGARFPLRVVSAIVSGFLEGLQAAHEATDDNGEPLGIVHRDVSPQNVLVSFAGITKLADFGIAKAAGNMHSTGDGSAKGKLSYMAPEQVNSQPVTPRTDVYAAGIVLWECLTREKLVAGGSAAERVRALLELEVQPPSALVPDLPPELDALVMRALEKDPANRFPSAKAMAAELQRVVPPASSIEVSDWVREVIPELVRERDAALTQLQRMSAPAASGPTSTGPFRPPTSSQRVPVSSQTEASGSNVTINDYLSASQKGALPPKMPRTVLLALVTLPALGVIGVVLVLFTFLRGKHAPAEAPMPMPTTTTAAPTPTPTSSESARTDIVEPPAIGSVAVVAPGASTAKPKPGAPGKPTATGKKCRIVAMPDKAGRMKFEEVCSP